MTTEPTNATADAPAQEPAGEGQLLGGKFKSADEAVRAHAEAEKELRRLQNRVSELEGAATPASPQPQPEIQPTPRQAEPSSGSLFASVADEVLSRGGVSDQTAAKLRGLGLSDSDIPLVAEFVKQRDQQFSESLKGIVDTDARTLIDFANRSYDEKTLDAYQAMIDAGKHAAVLPLIEADYKQSLQNAPQSGELSGSARGGAGGFQSVDEIKAAFNEDGVRFSHAESLDNLRKRLEATDPEIVKKWESGI